MRGGKREGAGRPACRQGQKVVSLRMMPDYSEKLNKLAKEHRLSTGQMVEKLIDAYK